MGQLHSLLHPHMLRRLKRDVMKQLPPKQEQMVSEAIAAPLARSPGGAHRGTDGLGDAAGRLQCACDGDPRRRSRRGCPPFAAAAAWMWRSLGSTALFVALLQVRVELSATQKDYYRYTHSGSGPAPGMHKGLGL